MENFKNLPLSFSLGRIMNYPIFWQESIEILYLLRGSINVAIENEVYTLNEGEIEIINSGEIHQIYSQDPNNLVLILNIDPNFFEGYYDGAKDMYFYTNSLDKNAQHGRKYRVLREYISILYYEYTSKLDDYEEVIEDKLVKLMYHLLNDFHYLFYEEEGLREDELQLERYHRIINYLRKNYMNKVSLQEIANREFLSPQYLSYKIKDTFGQSFNDFLNNIRIEESRKLLLRTDKSILEISEEVGFSHIRYYNKHFKIQYKLSPNEYRKKYKLSWEDLEGEVDMDLYPLEEGLDYVKYLIEDYERYNYDNRIRKVYIDFQGDVIEKIKKPDLIDLGDISLLLETENKILLKEIQEEIGFKYGIINSLFSQNMDIYRGKGNRFINWTKVENVLDFLDRIKITPIIDFSNVEAYVREEFLSYFSHIYGPRVESWMNYDPSSLGISYLEEEINPAYDSLRMFPHIIYRRLYLKENLVARFMDEISKETILSNDSFFGGQGIVSSNYLKKPSYYAYMFLSLLGEDLIYKNKGCLVTRSKEGYQILIFNPEEGDLLSSDEKSRDVKFSINLTNTYEDYQITKYEINKNHGSVYNKWMELGSPERLENHHWDILREFVHPNISFYYGKTAIVQNILTKIKPGGGVLYKLDRVLKEEI